MSPVHRDKDTRMRSLFVILLAPTCFIGKIKTVHSLRAMGKSERGFLFVYANTRLGIQPRSTPCIRRRRRGRKTATADHKQRRTGHSLPCVFLCARANKHDENEIRKIYRDVTLIIGRFFFYYYFRFPPRRTPSRSPRRFYYLCRTRTGH